MIAEERLLNRLAMLTMTNRMPRARHSASHAETEAIVSLIGPGAGVRGELEIDGDLVISGLVKGRIAALRLFIATDGYVEGDIIAREVTVKGRLNGRIFSPTVVIAASAEIKGRVFHTNVTIEKGAHIVGRMPWRPVSYFDRLDSIPEYVP
jgi:cytoskeletal protein CcmA (bactofilin family)